ncbi:hypothetical protein HNQ88_000889 [Aureibacter tunicatorum]|uniref:Uncharacterized protein n=1 Tax=Aureibacter tunicatorum TaxID=866807 RepID=A0AAE4BRG4_9BACT|nr:hypothetical protein [Aureibacter tunicatorum]BDD02946.1 hypothetical protein AUTU_04290 [Aureibacter tunicatorum]
MIRLIEWLDTNSIALNKTAGVKYKTQSSMTSKAVRILSDFI